MWQTREFKTEKEMLRFIDKNKNRIQYEIIFINNGYGIEFRKLRRIEWDIQEQQ